MSCGLMQREKLASGIEALMDFESFPRGLKPVLFERVRPRPYGTRRYLRSRFPGFRFAAPWAIFPSSLREERRWCGFVLSHLFDRTKSKGWGTVGGAD
jgi:hypothetical protein